MFKQLLLAAAVTCAAASAIAAPAGVTLSHGGTMTSAAAPRYTTPAQAPKGTVIFSNLGTKKALYDPSTGWTVSAKGSAVGAQQWIAAPFTPSSSTTVTEVEAAVGYVTGTNGVTIGLYADAGGVPGTALATKSVKNLTTFGTCCKIARAKFGSGVKVTSGTTYWVAATLSKKTSDTWDAWNLTTDQNTSVNGAFDTGSGWQPTTLSPAPAFAVFGP